MTEVDDLMAELSSHDFFFSRIIGMIPKDLYKPSEADTEVELNTKYFKHRKLPLAADERKSISKQRKDEKYAPFEELSSPPEDDNDNLDTQADQDTIDCDDQVNVALDNSYDGLRQRLQNRILGLKSARTSQKPAISDEQAAAMEKNKKDRRKDDAKSKKSNNINKSARPIRDELMNNSSTSHEDSDNDNNDNDNNNSTGSGKDDTIEQDVEYSLGGPSNRPKSSLNTGAAGAGQAGSKVKRLNRMLEEVQKKRARLDALASDAVADPLSKKRLREEQWTDALKTAAGDHNHNTSAAAAQDAAKIKKALKRIEKTKQKSAAEWGDRLEAVQEAQTARLQKREQNIQTRKDGGTAATVEAPVEKATSTRSGQATAAGAADRPAGEGKGGGKSGAHYARYAHGANMHEKDDSTATAGAAGGGGASSGGKPHGKSNGQQSHNGSKSGGNSHSPSFNGKQHHGSSKGGSASGKGGGKSPHSGKPRAGFEGRKTEFLNKKPSTR